MDPVVTPRDDGAKNAYSKVGTSYIITYKGIVLCYGNRPNSKSLYRVHTAYYDCSSHNIRLRNSTFRNAC